MLALRDEGKTRAVGVCNHSVEQLDAAERIGSVQSVQPPLSLIRRDSAADVVPWAQANASPRALPTSDGVERHGCGHGLGRQPCRPSVCGTITGATLPLPGHFRCALSMSAWPTSWLTR